MCEKEFWSLKYGEMRMFENGMLRSIFVRKREEITGSGKL
jgi:hypothetical protein